MFPQAPGRPYYPRPYQPQYVVSSPVSAPEKERSLGYKVGGAVGHMAHKVVKYVTGLGDYKVRQNTLVETNSPPAVYNRGNKEFVVRHREYIQDIYSAGGVANGVSPFALQAFAINPGMLATFPWLASVSSHFEQYRIEGMLFEYKSLYSDAVVTQNGSIGSVILATEYNSSQANFANKQVMENHQYTQSAKPSSSITHPIECARSVSSLTELYVRNGDLAANQDIKTYDFGRFQIASQGIPLGAAGAGVNLGELWVTYQICLIKPQLALSDVSGSYTRYLAAAPVGDIVAANPLGTASLTVFGEQVNSEFPLTIVQSTRTITFPRSPAGDKRYVVNFTWVPNSGSTGLTAPTFITSASLTVNSQVKEPQASVATQTAVSVIVDITVARAVEPGSAFLANLTFNQDGLWDPAKSCIVVIDVMEVPLVR